MDVVLSDATAGGDALSAAVDVLAGPSRAARAGQPGYRSLTAAITAGAMTLPEIVRRLDAAGVEAKDVSIRRPTLNEVFLRPRPMPRKNARDTEAARMIGA